MSVKTAYSIKDTVEEAVKEIKDNLAGITPVAVLYFSSMKYDPATLAGAMEKAFSGAAVFGNTTAGEIVTGRMLKNSIVAMALDKETISKVSVQVVENIRSENNVAKAFSEFEKIFRIPMRDMDYRKYVGIILIDGMSGAEERIIDTVGDLTNVLFVGGSAGDDLQFRATYVFAGGRAYTNAAVLALLQPAKGFDIVKTQSFRETGKKLLATKVDEPSRKVIEFNGIPARIAYAKALGTSLEDAGNHFMHNPVGLMIENEPYVRSPQRFDGDSMHFYCNIKEGMELSLLESTDIVSDTKKAVEKKIAEWGKPSAMINFHCILRTLELEQQNKTEEYGKIFADIPTIGFSTYGEEYLGHINQTSTILFLK